MRVLVACEFSGVVRNAFLEAGHFAMSCDLIPSQGGSVLTKHGVYGFHIQDDVKKIMSWGTWDMMIAFPPCTYLSKAGGWCWKYKQKEQQEALDFVQQLMDAPIPQIAIENPVGRISTAIRKPDQIIQPWMFGNPWTKETCLWLKNLPKLEPTDIVEPCGNWVKPGNNRPHRRFNDVKEGAKGNQQERSRTFLGIAEAMAAQWGGLDA